MTKKKLTPTQILVGDVAMCILAFAGFTYIAYILVGAGA